MPGADEVPGVDRRRAKIIGGGSCRWRGNAIRGYHEHEAIHRCIIDQHIFAVIGGCIPFGDERSLRSFVREVRPGADCKVHIAHAEGGVIRDAQIFAVGGGKAGSVAFFPCCGGHGIVIGQMVRPMTVVACAAGLVQLPPGRQAGCAWVGGGGFAGDIANRIVIVVLGVLSADRIQPIQFVIGVVPSSVLDLSANIFPPSY